MLSFTDAPRVELIRGQSFADYRALPGLNQSLLKEHDADYDGSPDLYLYRALTQKDDKDSQALREGRAFHTLLLEPDTFLSIYRTLDEETEEAIFQEAKAEAVALKKKTKLVTCATLADFRAESGRGFTTSAAYKAWAGSDPREILPAEFCKRLEGMCEAIHENPDVMEHLAGASRNDCEVTGLAGQTWRDGDNAGKFIQLKARFDILAPSDMIDAKTCRTVNRAQFAAQAYKLGYDLQADHYLDVAKKAGEPRKRFGFLAQEKTPPFRNCIHWMPDIWVKHARIRRLRILSEIADHIRLNRWPRTPSGMLEPREGSWLAKALEELEKLV